MFGCESEPGQPRLAQEAAHDRAVARLGVQLLERHPAIEVGLAREVDDRHPAAPEFAADLVAIACARVFRLAGIESHLRKDPAHAGRDTSRTGEQMQAKTCRRLIAIAIAAAATSSAPAHAGIWQPVTTPTSRRSRDRLPRRRQPVVHDLELDLQAGKAPAGPTAQPARHQLQRHRVQPRGTIGIAVGDAGVLSASPAAAGSSCPVADDLQLRLGLTARASGAYTLSAPVMRTCARALGQRLHGLHRVGRNGS